MPFKFRTKVTGKKKVEKEMVQKMEDLKEQAKDILEMNAYEYEGTAKRLVPVDTGKLRASIKTEGNADRTSFKVTANTHYAGYVEYGTHKQKAQPYMGPAKSIQENKLRRDMYKLTKGV